MRKTIALALTVSFLSMGSVLAQDVEQINKRYNMYYNNAVLYLNNNQYTKAIVEFKKVLRYQPYDITVRQALSSAYLKRANDYINQKEEYQKAIVDLKSALFYLKYWDEKTNTPELNSMKASASTAFAQLDKRHNPNKSSEQRFNDANILRAQGELPAAGYDYMVLSNIPKYKQKSLENAGDIYKSLNNNLEAISLYRDAIKMDPKNAKLHFKYATILDEAKNHQAAADEYNLALKYGEKNPELLDILENLWTSRVMQNNTDAQAYINLGTIYQYKSDFKSARECYQKALALSPQDRVALLNLASLYVGEKKYKEAIVQYDSLLAKYPNNAEIIKYKALAYEQMGDYKNAIAQYKAALAINPSDLSSKEAIDNIVSQKFSPDEKLNYMLVQANNNPKNSTMQYSYAYAQHELKNYDEALSYYKKTVEANPKKVEAYINMILIYNLKEDSQNALKVANLGLGNNPNNKDLTTHKDNILKTQSANIYNVATELYEKKEYEKALVEYKKVPMQTQEVILAMASCNFELKNYKEAIKYYNKNLAKSPKNTDTLYSVALCYNELGDTDNAVLYFDKILAINPDDETIKNYKENVLQTRLATMLQEGVELYNAQNLDGALTVFQNTLMKYPNNPNAMHYKAMILTQKGNIDGADYLYRLIIQQSPDFDMAYYSYGLMLDNKEKYEKAISYYDKFIEKKELEKSKDEYYDFAKSRTKELKEYLKAKNETTAQTN